MYKKRGKKKRATSVAILGGTAQNMPVDNRYREPCGREPKVDTATVRKAAAELRRYTKSP